jgi:hypothetical protein
LPAVLAASPLTVEVHSALRAQIAPLLGHAGGDALNVATKFTAQPHGVVLAGGALLWGSLRGCRRQPKPHCNARERQNSRSFAGAASLDLLRILRFLFQLSNKAAVEEPAESPTVRDSGSMYKRNADRIQLVHCRATNFNAAQEVNAGGQRSGRWQQSLQEQLND